MDKLTVPDDLAFQLVGRYPSPNWLYRVWECERYPALRIHAAGRPKARYEWAIYEVLDSDRPPGTPPDPRPCCNEFKSLEAAYRFLMSRPRRVRRGKNQPRQDAHGDRLDRKAKKHLSKKADRRGARS